MDDLIREMIEPPRSALDRGRRTRLAATAATVTLAGLGVTSLTTSALFTDNETLAGSEFTTGTIRITPETAQTFVLREGGMAPGDTAYGVVTVTNTGSLEHRYTVSVQGVNAADDVVDLAGELELTVLAARSGASAAASCRDGATGALTELTSLAAIPTALTQIVGSTATGQDAAPGGGDRVLGTLASEELCVVVHLPLETDNTFQETSTTVSLTFDAEQTANT